MKEKQLQPIILSPKFDEEVEKEILLFLSETLFAPIIKQMEETRKTYFNAKSSIEDALRQGRIQYSHGVFKGNFNAQLTKEFRKLGMKFDSRMKGYRKELTKLPIPMQVVIAQTESNYQKMAQGMIDAIETIDVNKELERLTFEGVFNDTVDQIDKEFNKTVARKIGVAVDITSNQRDAITKGFSENLKLFIKEFSDKEVLILREQVEKAVFSGIRAESLQKVIQDRFGVSKHKAKFLAKQELSLLTSKYKEAKYTEAGILKYKWSTSQDARVRQDHKDLNGKVFSFDDPPIENRDTGARANPGEPFGCRCVAIPVIEV